MTSFRFCSRPTWVGLLLLVLLAHPALAQPDVRDTTVAGRAFFSAPSLTAGPDVVVAPGGELTLHGHRIGLRAPFSVAAGGTLHLLTGGDVAAPRAVAFGAPGDYLEVPHDPSLAPDAFTIELWLRVDDLGDPARADGEQTLLDKRGAGTGYNLRLAGTAFPLPAFAFVLPGGASTQAAVGRGTWTHLAVTQDADTLRLYLDGELHDARPNAYASGTSAPLRIGQFLGYPNDELGLRGALDELRIWNVARSPEAIRSTMHQALSGAEAGLVAYWDFDWQHGDTFPDRTAYRNDAVRHGDARLIDSDAPVGFVPPPAPAGLRAYGTPTSIDLAWSSDGHPGGYEIFRGDHPDFLADAATMVAAVAGSTFTDASVVPDRLYYYALRAVDADARRSRASAPAASRARAEPGDYLAGAYYYPWYGPAEGGHDWQGANVRSLLSPPQEPLLGPYSSRDAEVIRQHLDWMEAYGVDFLVSSWWGVESWEDVTLRDHLLPALASSPVEFTIYYESAMLGISGGEIAFDAARQARLLSDFDYLADTYFDHPNLLRIDGRPVVFLYLSRLFAGDYAQAFTQLRSRLAARGYDVFLVGDEVGWGPTDEAHLQFLDAVSPYILYGDPRHSGYPAANDFFADLSVQAAGWEAAAGAQGKAVIPSVFPGFNSRQGSDGPAAPRAVGRGAASTSMLETSIRVMKPFVDPALRMIMITSWNEWHEDTQIEPVAPAPATQADQSADGRAYTQGYAYEGDAFAPLEVVRTLLAPEIGSGTATATEGLPPAYVLAPNYPNPFNPVTTLRYALPETGPVHLAVYDLLGRRVRVLVDEAQPAGWHEVAFDAGALPSGTYLYRLRTERATLHRAMTLLR